MSRLRSLSRLLPAVAGTLVLLAAASPVLAQDDGRVEVDVKIGLNTHVREFCWFPIRVTLKSWFNEPREAVVTIRRKRSNRQPQVVLTQRVTLQPPPPGGPLDYHLFFYSPPITPGENRSFKVTVTEPGGATLLRRKRIEVKERDDGTAYEVIHWDPQLEVPEALTQIAGTGFLLSRNESRQQLVVSCGPLPLPVQRDGNKPGGWRGEWPWRHRRMTVLNLAPDELPDDWCGYDMADAVFLADPQWETLNKQNRYRALITWVRAGGHLMIALTGNVAAVRTTPMDDDAGVTILEAGSYDGARQLERLGPDGSVVGTVDLGIEPSAQPLPLLGVEPGPETRVRVATVDGRPVVLQRPVGLGRVTLFTLDPSHRLLQAVEPWSLEQSQNADNATNPAVTWTLNGWIADELLHDRLREQWYPVRGLFDDQERAIDVSGALRNTATRLAIAEPVSFTLIALFIGVYVLVIGPLDYLVLGLFSLRHWTWLTFTLAVIGFFLFAELGSESIKGGDMAVRQVSVLTFSSDGKVERGDLVAGVYSQANAGYTVWVDRPWARVTRMERAVAGDDALGGRPQQPAGQPVTVDVASDLRVAQPVDADATGHPGHYLKFCLLPRWVTIGLTATWVDEPGTERLDTERLRGNRIRVTNRLGRPLAGLLAIRLDAPLNGDSAVSVYSPEIGLVDTDMLDIPAPGDSAWVRRPTGTGLFGTQPGQILNPPDASDDPAAPEPSVELLSGHTVPQSVAAVLAATVSQMMREAGHGGRGFRVEPGQLRGLDLCRALATGATVVIGWGDDYEGVGQPIEPLQIDGWAPVFQHRLVVRSVVWPGAVAE